MPDLLRRIAVLTIVSLAGIALLTPLAARSALPEVLEAQQLLDAVDEPQVALDRGGTLTSRAGASTLQLAVAPLAPEVLAPANALGEPPVADMEATLATIATPRPRPAPAAPPSGAVDASVWDRLAQCESSGNWSINTGNGYYGGLQFSYSTWHGYGGGEFAEYPHQATREQQIIVAERLHAVRGFQPWPACRAKLGLP